MQTIKKVAQLTLLALIPSLAVNAASPDLILQDGQEVTISGRIKQAKTTKFIKGRITDVNIVTLKPKNFIATKPNQSFNSRLIILATSPEIESSIANLYEQDATVNCLISFEKKSDAICNVQSIARFQNIPTQPVTTIPNTSGGGWFRSAHELLLREQLNNCENFKAAGNPNLYKSCRTRTLNAHDYLLDRANISTLPLTGWSFCADQIQYDLPSGAQCLAAVELLCPPDENKEFADFNQCSKLMSSGAWVSNPTIQRMTFTAPAR